jgi:hypothetical protein
MNARYHHLHHRYNQVGVNYFFPAAAKPATTRSSGDPVTTTLPQTARPRSSNDDNLISSPTPSPVFSLLSAIFLHFALMAFLQSLKRLSIYKYAIDEVIKNIVVYTSKARNSKMQNLTGATINCTRNKIAFCDFFLIL